MSARSRPTSIAKWSLSELKKLQEQARGIAHEFETAVQSEVKGIESSVGSVASTASEGLGGLGTDNYRDAWDGKDDWTPTRFSRRYKPGPSIDELTEEIAKLKRQLAMPETLGRTRHKYAPRARLNRPRIRR